MVFLQHVTEIFVCSSSPVRRDFLCVLGVPSTGHAWQRIKASRLLKKTSEARRTKIDERRRTLLYVDAKSVECNEAYESFSAVC